MAEELADIHAEETVGQVDNGTVETKETPETPEKPRSIREEIQAAVKSAGTAPSKDKPRDETGKFTKAEAAPKEAAPAKQESPEAKPEPKAEPSTAQASPPPGWSKESKELFKTLPASIQADVIKRENEVSTGFKKYADDAKRYQEIEQVIAPRRAEFQRHGIQTDAQAINRLLAWENAVRTNPVQGIVDLARAYGVDLTRLAQPTGQSSEQEQIPAHLKPVVDQFGQVAQTVQGLQQRLDTQERDRIERDIQSFAKDKPHFEKVRPLMGKLLAGQAATTLDDAYQQAIKLDPEVSALIAQDAKDKAEAEAKKAAEEKARQARLASSSLRSAPTQGSVQSKQKSTAKSVRESLMEAVQEGRA